MDQTYYARADHGHVPDTTSTGAVENGAWRKHESPPNGVTLSWNDESSRARADRIDTLAEELLRGRQPDQRDLARTGDLRRLEQPAGSVRPVARDQVVVGRAEVLRRQVGVTGDDLAGLIVSACHQANPTISAADIIVIAQKIFSKAEGRLVRLAEVTPSPRAIELAHLTGKPADHVEVILWDTAEVIRAKKDLLVVEHRLGFISANAGVDHSNVSSEPNVAVADSDEHKSGLQRRRRHGLHTDLA